MLPPECRRIRLLHQMACPGSALYMPVIIHGTQIDTLSVHCRGLGLHWKWIQMHLPWGNWGWNIPAQVVTLTGHPSLAFGHSVLHWGADLPISHQYEKTYARSRPSTFEKPYSLQTPHLKAIRKLSACLTPEHRCGSPEGSTFQSNKERQH